MKGSFGVRQAASATTIVDWDGWRAFVRRQVEVSMILGVSHVLTLRSQREIALMRQAGLVRLGSAIKSPLGW
jgi:hypothetical protein